MEKEIIIVQIIDGEDLIPNKTKAFTLPPITPWHTVNGAVSPSKEV